MSEQYRPDYVREAYWSDISQFEAPSKFVIDAETAAWLGLSDVVLQREGYAPGGMPVGAYSEILTLPSGQITTLIHTVTTPVWEPSTISGRYAVCYLDRSGVDELRELLIVCVDFGGVQLSWHGRFAVTFDQPLLTMYHP